MAESFKTEIFKLDGKNISITTSATESLPLVLVNTFAGEADSLWKECAALDCPPFVLASISGMDWERRPFSLTKKYKNTLTSVYI